MMDLATAAAGPGLDPDTQRNGLKGNQDCRMDAEATLRCLPTDRKPPVAGITAPADSDITFEGIIARIAGLVRQEAGVAVPCRGGWSIASTPRVSSNGPTGMYIRLQSVGALVFTPRELHATSRHQDSPRGDFDAGITKLEYIKGRSNPMFHPRPLGSSSTHDGGRRFDVIGGGLRGPLRPVRYTHS